MAKKSSSNPQNASTSNMPASKPISRKGVDFAQNIPADASGPGGPYEGNMGQAPSNGNRNSRVNALPGGEFVLDGNDGVTFGPGPSDPMGRGKKF